MASTILTPVTLWQNFNSNLPPNEEILSERRERGAVFRDVYFYGREVGNGAGRVKIYGRYVTPEGPESYPAIMILFEAGLEFDEELIMRFVANGYAVLAADYYGERKDAPHYTVYPKIVSYANFERAGRHIEFCDETAKETSWYEWAGVARYGVEYLRHKKEVTEVGALGIRTGGEILFKIAPYAPIGCMISVCAAGWLAYRGIGKFGGENRILDEERHRFIAGIDSQSYAPYIKCPVLLVSAINDKKYNYDRVYDTFRQINPEVEKAILFSAHGSGLVGSHSMMNINLFFDKYLKKRTVYIPRPITVSVEEDEEGDFVARGSFDPAGDIKEFGIFYTENIAAFKTRDWTRVLGRPEDLDGSVGKVPLSLYLDCKKALVYAFVNYSNNFAVTTQILEVNVAKRYKNAVPGSRVLYREEDGKNGFSTFRRPSVADCFSETNSGIRREAGFGGIMGIDTMPGIISYRVGEPRFAPPEGASFRFDAYAPEDGRVKVIFFMDEEEKTGYSAEAAVAGKGRWKSLLFDAGDFKSETGAALPGFGGVVSVAFVSKEHILINNVLWI